MISRYGDPPECPTEYPNRLIAAQFAVLGDPQGECFMPALEPDTKSVGNYLRMCAGLEVLLSARILRRGREQDFQSWLHLDAEDQQL